MFGGLVPFGQVWRTGADEATAIAFSGDVNVEGQTVAAGVYSLFTIPGAERWTVILNRTQAQWGAYRYDASQDALRVEVEPVAHPHTEQFDITLEGDVLTLKWADVAVPIQLAAP